MLHDVPYPPSFGSLLTPRGSGAAVYGSADKFDAIIKADTATYAEKLKDAITPN